MARGGPTGRARRSDLLDRLAARHRRVAIRLGNGRRWSRFRPRSPERARTEMSMPMDEPTLPADLIEARHTPLFDAQSLPPGLAVSHRTTVWATLHVQTGTVRYIDLEGPSPRDACPVAGDSSVIVPGVEHHVQPSTDAKFFIQFYREPGVDTIPGQAPNIPHRRSGPWEHRERDLDTPDEVFTGDTPIRRRSPRRPPTALLQLRPRVHRLAGPHQVRHRLLVPRRPPRTRLRDQCHREPSTAPRARSVHPGVV